MLYLGWGVGTFPEGMSPSCQAVRTLSVLHAAPLQNTHTQNSINTVSAPITTSLVFLSRNSRIVLCQTSFYGYANILHLIQFSRTQAFTHKRQYHSLREEAGSVGMALRAFESSDELRLAGISQSQRKSTNTSLPLQRRRSNLRSNLKSNLKMLKDVMCGGSRL